VELLGVGFAADGDFIMVSFRALPEVARNWQSGMVYLVDEATGAVYNEIPVMPIVGPLFGRPVQRGQEGYVMFVNAARGLKPGSVVTVVLGEFKQEHITVEGDSQ
jgi:hypothetical protein